MMGRLFLEMPVERCATDFREECAVLDSFRWCSTVQLAALLSDGWSRVDFIASRMLACPSIKTQTTRLKTAGECYII